MTGVQTCALPISPPPPQLGGEVRFIYPSFPNRGLLQLLRMFPRIRAVLPRACLDVFVRFDLEEYYAHCAEEVREVQRLLQELAPCGVRNHGWVQGSVLARFWDRAHIWLYPCTFQETFCKVAQEAAAHGVLAIAPPLAALAETAAEGVLIPGDASSLAWQAAAIRACVNAVEDWEGFALPRIAANRKAALAHSYPNIISTLLSAMEY